MKSMTQWLLAVFLGLIVVACGQKTPEDVAKTFMEKLYAGDSKTVVSMVHIPQEHKQQAGINERVEGKINMSISSAKAHAAKAGGVAEITAEPAEYAPDNKGMAKVNVNVRFKNGDSSSERLKLIQVGNAWEVVL